MSECPRCSQPLQPVWATYEARTACNGFVESRAPATATLRLPMTSCARGHIDGWRADPDFLSDLAVHGSLVAGPELASGSVPVARPWLRGRRCGACAQKLELRETGDRVAGHVEVHPPDVSTPGRIDLDLPEFVCGTCGARPHPEAGRVDGTAADLHGWLYQLFADAMPPDAAVTVEPRA